MRLLLPLALLSLTPAAHAQWALEDAHVTADLRGIRSLGGGVAWASGTNGTVLRTEDAGFVWQLCAVPPGADQLDFRGIQGFDHNTAIVMSSGPGDQSRLYKTTDGCQTWKLLFTNPDKDGFWDALQFDPTSKTSSRPPSFGVLLGDPVDGRFVLFLTFDEGEHWERQIRESPKAEAKEAIFAASNSSLAITGMQIRSFATGGSSGSRLLTFWVGHDDTQPPDPLQVAPGAREFHPISRGWLTARLPVQHPSESAGVFAIGSSPTGATVIAVGGDYKLPDRSGDNAWFYTGPAWTAASVPPHGYRSAVAYDDARKLWITVGPNGTDISRDDGRTWCALRPGPGDAPDADRNWNALSMPYAVGPHGRIGVLRPEALAHEPASKR